MVLHEVPFLRHQQGPRRRLARRELAPHKPPRPYQREEQRIDSIHRLKDRPRKKQDHREPANHSIPEKHLGVGLHCTQAHSTET
ncbi:hypothetical protein E2C01_038951 [Portunus trituberculatus]|uniref:Uncharacterized protein n=1 Tax=Portunus trituberculatus TaxID=210409 RepID=A0A5B7FII7_PORTR|nr:hypothetical protein [Portunus trituberculatus]